MGVIIAVISSLPNLYKDFEDSVRTKTTGKNGKDYENLNVYLNYVDRTGDNGKGLSTGFIAFNDIPKPEKEDDEDLGVTWNWKPVNKFYAQKIKELQEKFQNGQTASQPQVNTEAPRIPVATPAEAFQSATNVNEKEHQDLPF